MEQSASSETKLPKEIERKFLVKKVPNNLSQYKSKQVLTGYLGITKEHNEIRLRQLDDKYFLTVKNGVGKVRTECEIEISQEQFDLICPLAKNNSIKKTRYFIPHEKGTIELDIYNGNLKDLNIVEMEFSSEEKCDEFTAPDWFGKEITDDLSYSNYNLSKYGLPK